MKLLQLMATISSVCSLIAIAYDMAGGESVDTAIYFAILTVTFEIKRISPASNAAPATGYADQD